jgi:hypothetical protein
VEERAHVLDQVRCLLVDRLGVGRTLEQIDPNAPLFAGGLGVDAAELDRQLEATFGLSLLDGAVVPRTVGAVVDLVVERMRLARHDSVHDHGGPRG